MLGAINHSPLRQTKSKAHRHRTARSRVHRHAARLPGGRLMPHVTMNVRHRVGLLGRLAIAGAKLLGRLRLPLPVPALVWAVNRSSYVSVNGGPWRRLRLDLNAREFQ
jgi:hypothetical protein